MPGGDRRTLHAAHSDPDVVTTVTVHVLVTGHFHRRVEQSLLLSPRICFHSLSPGALSVGFSGLYAVTSGCTARLGLNLAFDAPRSNDVKDVPMMSHDVVGYSL